MDGIKYVTEEWPFRSIFGKCPSCKLYHFWNIIIAAISVENVDLVRKALDYKVKPSEGGEGHLVPVPITFRH